MMISLALNALERTPKQDEATGRTARDVLFVMDEFAVLGHLPAIENAAGQMAGFGVKLWPILQDLSQLQALYDKRWETFLANAGVHQFFGNADLTTLKHVSDRLGVTATEGRSVNLASQLANEADSRTSFGVSISATPLLHQDEVRTLFSRDKQRQVVLFPEHDPLWLLRANYDMHRLFSGLTPSTALPLASAKPGTSRSFLGRFARGSS